MRLHQSYSGYLLGRGGRTLRELRRDIEKGRTPTKAMEDGALMDQFLFGGSTYCEVQPCTRRSGPRKGEVFEPEDWASADAQEQRDAARERGQVCCLKHEVDAAWEQRSSILELLMRHGIDIVNEHRKMMGEILASDAFRDEIVAPAPGVYTQPKIQWNSDGVLCEGTLDILHVYDDMRWRIVDTKLSTRCDEEFASTQAANMGWDVQCAAYIEACILGLGLSPEKFSGYGLAVCEKRSRLYMSAMHWLEDIYVHCGELQWDTCKALWSEAVKNDEWPGVSDSKLSPPGYYVTRVTGGLDKPEAGGLEDLGLDLSGLETEE